MSQQSSTLLSTNCYPENLLINKKNYEKLTTNQRPGNNCNDVTRQSKDNPEMGNDPEPLNGTHDVLSKVKTLDISYDSHQKPSSNKRLNPNIKDVNTKTMNAAEMQDYSGFLVCKEESCKLNCEEQFYARIADVSTAQGSITANAMEHVSESY